MNEKEARIKEQRTIEATRKGYMGANGKFGLILKHLGQPIISHTNENTIFYDFYEELDEPKELGGSPEEIQNQIPYMLDLCDEPNGYGWRETRNPKGDFANVHNIGWHFDGLSRGMHLEIRYLDSQKELTVSYKGYMVYKEVSGELAAFAPLPEWEQKIEQLHTVAKSLENDTRKLENKSQRKSAEQAKQNWLSKMRQKWGF